jgi:hypothetical protein
MPRPWRLLGFLGLVIVISACMLVGLIRVAEITEHHRDAPEKLLMGLMLVGITGALVREGWRQRRR